MTRGGKSRLVPARGCPPETAPGPRASDEGRRSDHSLPMATKAARGRPSLQTGLVGASWGRAGGGLARLGESPLGPPVSDNWQPARAGRVPGSGPAHVGQPGRWSLSQRPAPPPQQGQRPRNPQRPPAASLAPAQPPYSHWAHSPDSRAATSRWPSPASGKDTK